MLLVLTCSVDHPYEKNAIELKTGKVNLAFSKKSFRQILSTNIPKDLASCNFINPWVNSYCRWRPEDSTSALLKFKFLFFNIISKCEYKQNISCQARKNWNSLFPRRIVFVSSFHFLSFWCGKITTNFRTGKSGSTVSLDYGQFSLNPSTTKNSVCIYVFSFCHESYLFISYLFALFMNEMKVHIIPREECGQQRFAKWEIWSVICGFELVILLSKRHKRIRVVTADPYGRWIVKMD